MMLFKVDENLPEDVAALLRGAGHDVHTVYDEGLRGSDDQRIAAKCQSEQRAIVTLDLDFADIRAYPPASSPGLVVLRVSSQSRRHILNVFSRVVPLLEREPVAGKLWIVTESAIRIRGG